MNLTIYNLKETVAEELNTDISNIFENICYAQFKFKSLKEAQNIASFISHICDDKKLGYLALLEIFLNSIEHGNLKISYNEKTELHKNDKWVEEIEKRTQLDENKNKYVIVDVKKFEDHFTITVTDSGEGFDWKKFENYDLSRAKDTHGRGIALAKSLVFDTVDYVGNGNQVICTIKLKEKSN